MIAIKTGMSFENHLKTVCLRHEIATEICRVLLGHQKIDTIKLNCYKVLCSTSQMTKINLTTIVTMFNTTMTLHIQFAISNYQKQLVEYLIASLSSQQFP